MICIVEQTGESVTVREKGTMKEPENLPYGTPIDSPDMRYWQEDWLKYEAQLKSLPRYPLQTSHPEMYKVGDEVEVRFQHQMIGTVNMGIEWIDISKSTYENGVPSSIQKRIIAIPINEEEIENKNVSYQFCNFFPDNTSEGVLKWYDVSKQKYYDKNQTPYNKRILSNEGEQKEQIKEDDILSVLKECDEYLSEEKYENGKPVHYNSIGAYSVLHKKMKEAIASSHAEAIPEAVRFWIFGCKYMNGDITEEEPNKDIAPLGLYNLFQETTKIKL